MCEKSYLTQSPANSNHNHLPSSKKKNFNMLISGPPLSESMYFPTISTRSKLDSLPFPSVP